jgi:hypothetical protein
MVIHTNTCLRQYFNKNADCEKFLLDVLVTTANNADANEPPATPTLGALKMEHFANRKVTVEAFLKPFIHVRKWDIVKVEKGFKWPSKGDVAKARDGASECNLIRMAYDCREAPILLKEIAETPIVAPPTLRVPKPFCITADATCCNIVPFSVSPEWMDRVVRVFDSRGQHGCVQRERSPTTIARVQAKADRFATLAVSRLQQLLSRRLPGMSGWYMHWSFKWAVRNAVTMGAVLETMGLLRHDLDVNTEGVCLLRSIRDGAFTPAATTATNSDLEGSYLYFDNVNLQFIRSGKVGKKTVTGRDKDHLIGSLKGESLFYLLYPHLEKPAHKKSSQRRGHFQDLTLYSGLTYSRNANDDYCMLYDTHDKGGIFIWDEECLQELSTKCMSGADDLNEKKLESSSYLTELHLDLALSPTWAISESPGMDPFWRGARNT